MRSVLISLFLHLALIALIYEYQRQNLALKKEERFIFMEVSRGSTASPQRGGAHRRNSRKANQNDPSIKKHKTAPKPTLNLGLIPRDSGRLEGSVSSGEGQSGSEIGEAGRREGIPDGFDAANTMDLQREGETYPFYRALWKRVDLVLTYPEDFVQERISGSVSVQLAVDNRGVFKGEVLSIRGSESMLNAFALATLIHALKEPLPEERWIDQSEGSVSDRNLVVFDFEFRLFGPGAVPQILEHSQFKNILSFRREAYVDPKLNQDIDKWVKEFSKYSPGIIIIPGGFFIDFASAYRFYQYHFGSPKERIDQDDMRKKRLEMKKEVMESFIQKNK